MLRLVATLALAALLGGPGAAHADADRVLRFGRHGEAVATRSLAELRADAATAPASVRVHEPYEDGEAVFQALPLAAVLDSVYTPAWRTESGLLLLFTCADGYRPSVPAERAIAHRGWLAFRRDAAAGFTIDKLESGERKTIDLAPFYLVWENLDDPQLRSEGDYGWPYQLVGIDLIRARDHYPLMAPPDDASAQAKLGFDAFQVHCSRCHAINGQGGTIGQELNDPLNPVEVRGRDWLRRWIDDPSQMLPTSRMPRLNPALPDRAATIDAILAYLEALSTAKETARAD